MKKQTQILAIAIVAVVGTLTYCHFRSSTPEVPAVNPEEIGSLPPPEASEAPKAAVPPPTEGTSPSFLPTQMEDPQLFTSLQKMVAEMNDCIGTQAKFDENQDFNVDMLNNMVMPFLGEIVMTTNEWATSDIQTPSGEIRRIYLEYHTDIMSDTATALKYYSLGPSGEQKELPLSEEQMNDPSETLIASLEADGSLLGRSRSQRMFYQNGGNVLIVERNGKLYSMDVPLNGKRFRCDGMDAAATLKCQCL